MKAPLKSLAPLGGRQWKQLSQAVGLTTVHDGTYGILSGLAHGSALNANLTIGPGIMPGAGRPYLFTRDADREHQLSFWAFWFQLRTLTRAAAEFGHSLEPRSEEVLGYIRENEPNMTHAIALREHWIGFSGGG